MNCRASQVLQSCRMSGTVVSTGKVSVGTKLASSSSLRTGGGQAVLAETGRGVLTMSDDGFSRMTFTRVNSLSRVAAVIASTGPRAE